MSLERKLKPDRNMIGPLVPLSMLLLFGLSSLIFGPPIGLTTVAVLMWVFALFYLVVFARTGNLPHLFVVAYGAFGGYIIYTLISYIGAPRSEMLGVRLAYISGMFFFGFVLIFLVVNRRLKWRGREIFELAAAPVAEDGNGYTPRPRPVGRVEYSPEQLRGFARFAARNLIALPYITSQNITLVPVKMGDEFTRLLELNGDYRDATWVNFDMHGEVSVHIAHKDYLDYRQSPAFDALCASLGQVFIDFVELYTKGEGVRAIDRLDDLKLPVFS